MTSGENEIFTENRLNEKVFRLFSYLLVALMMACAGATVAVLARQLLPAMSVAYIALICFFVSLDSLFMSQRFKKYLFLSAEWLKSVVVQILALLVLIKMAGMAMYGWKYFVDQVSLWQSDFLGTFFSVPYLFAIVIAVMAWFLSAYFADLLDEMGLDQALIAQEVHSTQPGVAPVRERLISLIFNTGAVLVLVVGLTRIDFNASADYVSAHFNQLPVFSAGGASTLLYFMLALALLSQSQFIALQTRWSLQRIPVSRDIGRQWALYSVIFLAGLAILVSFLPTRYSLGILGALGFIIDIVGRILFFMIQLFIFLVFYLMNSIMNLFGEQPPFNLNMNQIIQQLPPVENAADLTAVPPWWEFAKSIAIWAIVITVIVFVLSQYLLQHREVVQGLRRLAIWRMFLQAWQAVSGLFSKAKQDVARLVETGMERLRLRRDPTQSGAWAGFLNPRRLSPRQRVMFFYLAMVRRGQESGYPREAAQTPHEYATRLERSLPDVEPEIETLTQSFMEARYSPHKVENEEANLVQKAWDHIRRLLQARQ